MTDYNELYRQERLRSRHQPRTPEEWDRRAGGMGADVAGENTYVQAFLARVACTGCRHVLDLGCGPGGLLVPLARQLERAWGVDFSAGMLREARQYAGREGVHNIELICADWMSEWERLPRADLVIASRCLDVDDMRAALQRLDALACKAVYLSYRIGRSFLDDDVLRAVGREVHARPTHDLIIRILRHQLGIEPTVDRLVTPDKVSRYPDADAFLQRIRWTLGALTHAEETNARRLYETLPLAEDGTSRLHIHPIAWALISWKK